MRKAILFFTIFSLTILPFANVLAFGTDNRFTGKPLDPSTNLYYYGQRYYDPNISQFTQPDPVSRYLADPQKLKQVTGQNLQEFLEDPQKLNEYNYTLNNPIKYTDPTGEQAVPVQQLAIPLISKADVVIATGAVVVTTVLVPVIIKAAEKVGEGIVAMTDSITALFSRSDGELIEKIDSFNKPIDEHIGKLNNTGDPKERDPRNRKDWKKHIEKALNNMKKVAEKIKNKEKREKQLEKIQKTRDDVDKIPVVVPQISNEKN
ncbi:MAG: RHS repeat-associated core domain-containing protein [Patescibacteria group bacterium]|jgi:RHS repeat-associated protein